MIRDLGADHDLRPHSGAEYGVRKLLNWTKRKNRFPTIVISVAALVSASAAHAEDNPIHMAIAWHADSDDVWVAWNYASKDVTELMALKDCAAVMGKPCVVGRSMSTGVAVLHRQQNGIPILSEGPDVASALAATKEQCIAAGTLCSLTRAFFVYDGNPMPHSSAPAAMDRVRKKYGAVIIAASAPKGRRIHVASGRPDAQMAINDALANCKREGGVDCKLLQWGGNTKIVVMSNSKGEIFANSGDYAGSIRSDLMTHCKVNNFTCTEQTVVDTRTEETSFYSLKP
jgi:Domain of unknown function (DUF4189)